MRKLMVLLVLTIMVLSVNAFSAKQITFWFAGGDPRVDLPLIKEYIKQFEEETGIKVKFVAIPWAENPHMKIQVAIASGKAPDLIKLGSPFEHVLAKYGLLEPLDNWLPKEFIDAFVPAMLENSRYGENMPRGLKGKLISIPYFTDIRPLLYRKDIFEERGIPEPNESWTWEEFVNYAQKLTFDRDGDGQIDVYGFGTSARYLSQWIVFVWQNGGKILDKNGYPIVNSPEFLDGVRFYYDLFQTYKVVQPGAVDAHLWDVRKLLAEGKVAMYMDCGDSAKVLYEELGDKLGVGLLPHNVAEAAFSGADSFVVPKQSRHKEEAIKLLMYLLEKERMLEYCKISGFLPTRRDVAADPFFSDDPVKKMYIEQLESARSWIKHPESSTIARFLRIAMQDSLTGKKTIEKAFEEAQVNITEHLKKKGFIK